MHQSAVWIFCNFQTTCNLKYCNNKEWVDKKEQIGVINSM